MTRLTFTAFAALLVAGVSFAQAPLIKPKATEPPRPTKPWEKPATPTLPPPVFPDWSPPKPPPPPVINPEPRVLPTFKPVTFDPYFDPLAAPRPNPFAVPARPTLSTGAFPEERARVQKLGGFPNLKDDFDVLAPHTGHPDHKDTHLPGVTRYNCIAWSLGVTDRWVWPRQPGQAAAVKDFDAEYAAVGLTRRKYADTALESGVRKVALYGKLSDAGVLELTHAARQDADGTWTSKLGGEPRIRHRTAEAVCGPAYGTPVAVYAGPR